MKTSDLALYAIYLRSTVEAFGVMADPLVRPCPGSSADRELAEARTLSLGEGTWGEDPVQTVYTAALMSYAAALDEGGAMAAALSGGVLTAIPAVVLARSTAEIASQAWWLLEPGTGARGRVERLQCLRLRSAIEGERAAGADGAGEAGRPFYAETQAQVCEYSRKLGLDIPRRAGYAHVCGSQRMPTVSRMVAAMFSDVGAEATYNSHSGFARGDLFALRQGFERSDDGRLVRPVVNERVLHDAVDIAVRALICPAGQLTELYGLDTLPGTTTGTSQFDAVTYPTAGHPN